MTAPPSLTVAPNGAIRDADAPAPAAGPTPSPVLEEEEPLRAYVLEDDPDIAALEADILRELREIENRKRRMAGAEPEEAPAVPQVEVYSALGHESSRQHGTPTRAKADEKTR